MYNASIVIIKIVMSIIVLFLDYKPDFENEPGLSNYVLHTFAYFN